MWLKLKHCYSQEPLFYYQTVHLIEKGKWTLQLLLKEYNSLSLQISLSTEVSQTHLDPEMLSTVYSIN